MAHFPESWWKKRPLIFAHRGASLITPENTLVAFDKAIEIGADGVELDVRLTLDGVPVVIHNAEVDRTTDGRGSVYSFTLSDLQNLDAGSWFDPVYKNQIIPTLEEVLDTIGSKTLINIELKARNRKEQLLAQKVCELVKKMALGERIWFSSFYPHLLRQTREHLPEVPNGYLYAVHSPIQDLKISRLPVEAVHPYYRAIGTQYVSRMHNRNKQVVVWTVDDVETARDCIGANVDVIISNDPGKLIQSLS